MNIPTTSADDLRAHLDALGVQTGDHLTVHSRLLSFGYIDGGVATVFEALREVVGPQATIVVPTYTLSRGTTYDIRMSPSQGVGILPEYIRQLPGVIRSACPMHNHVGLGAKAHVLKEPDGGVSIGSGSDFEALLTANFRLLLLGAGLTEGATFIHSCRDARTGSLSPLARLATRIYRTRWRNPSDDLPLFWPSTTPPSRRKLRCSRSRSDQRGSDEACRDPFRRQSHHSIE
jgi:aminoglycoside N3'-acetyltransferase